MSKNRVAKLVAIGKIEIFEEEIPRPKEEEVLIAVKSVGICGSDVHYFLEGSIGNMKNVFPKSFGHEPSGVVVESNSKFFKKGDRVAIEPGNACLKCHWCLRGKHNLCEKGTFMGANAPGAFADYIVVSEMQLTKIPKSMSYNIAALMEPVGVALHSVHLTSPQPNSNIAIVGSGSIGLCLMQTLKELGFKDIFMVDKLEYRVKKAEEMSAKYAFQLDKSSSEIKKITNGNGVQYVYDTGGTNETINLCVDIVGTNGTIGLIGIPSTKYVKYDQHKLRIKEVTLKNVRRSNQTLEEGVKLFSKNKGIKNVITHEFDIARIQKAFEIVSEYKENVIKCMIVNS